MSYENTGKKSPGNTISRDATYLDTNDGLLIPPCSADKSIVIYDVSSYGSGKLGTAVDGGGTQLCFINAGQNRFGISAIVPAGQGVYTNAQSGNITITYAVVDGLSVGSIRNTVTEGGGATTTTAAPADPCEFQWWNDSRINGDESLGASAFVTLFVTRSGNLTPTASIDYATSDFGFNEFTAATAGVDYVDTSGTLNFASGESQKSIEIYQLAADTVLEGTETFKVTLSNPLQTGGSATIGLCSGCGTGYWMPTAEEKVVAILEKHDIAVGFASGTSSVAEGDSGTSTHTVVVNRSMFPSAIATAGTVTVDYATSDGGSGATYAEAGVDYVATSGTLSFGPSDTTKNIDITINGDTDVEDDQFFNVTLSNPTAGAGVPTEVQVILYPTHGQAGAATHTVTITNDDVATTTTTTTTTTATPGAYFRVEDCTASGTYYIIDDSMSYAPSVGDVVFWMDTGYTTNYCGTITQTGIGGTSVGDIQGVEDFNSDPYTCATCDSENGGP